jgi:RNA polymerase sigma factor (sigma-70 family)
MGKEVKKLNWELATDEQLWNIIQHDWDVPKEHIEGLVTEGLKRKTFNHLIKHLINKKFDRWDDERRYHFEDLFAIGEIGVFVAMKNYKPGKGSFKTFAYMNIRSEFNHHINKVKSNKRKVYKNKVSLDVQRFDDNDEHLFVDKLIDESMNPEKVVLKKIYWEEIFALLSDRELDALVSFAQGYSMDDVAKKYGLSSSVMIHRAFHRGMLKINPNRPKVSLKELGLTTNNSSSKRGA